MRMLYSPQFHKSKECNRLATGNPERSSIPAALQFWRLGASGLSSWHSSSSSGAIQRRLNFGSTQNIGAKEADSIGMTRRHPFLLPRLSFFLHRGCAAALTFLFTALFAASVFIGPSAEAQMASTWNRRGQTAELRQDYDAAYEDYLHAHQKDPADMRYQARLDRMRFQAAAMHVDRGRVLRQNGDLAGALNQFTRALQIDPGNEAAAQEVQITQHQDQTPGASNAPVGATDDSAELKEIGNISAPLELKPVSDDPITLHTVEDIKNIYQVIGKMAGIPRTSHVGDPWPSIQGTSVHAWLAEAFNRENARIGRRRWLTELRVAPTDEHPGSTDLYDVDEQAVVDWKDLGPTSLAKIKSGRIPRHYHVQLLLYGLGCLRAGLPVRRVVLVALPRGASTLNGMYTWDREFGLPEDIALLQEVLRVTSAREKIAAEVVAGRISMDHIPITPDDDECFFCPFYRPEAAYDNGPGCPGTIGNRELIR